MLYSPQNIQISKPVYFNLIKLKRKESEKKRGKSPSIHSNYLCQFCKFSIILPALRGNETVLLGIKKAPAAMCTPSLMLFSSHPPDDLLYGLRKTGVMQS